MRRMIFLALAVGTIAFATVTAWADAPERDRPSRRPSQRQFDPMRLFDRLDADKTGAIVLEELPERLPERLKAMLAKADADEDGKVTREEFKAATEAARERMKAAAETARKRAEEGRKRHAERAKAGPAKACPSHRPTPRVTHRPMPDLKTLFKRMDRDNSGSLSLEEFTAGMRRLQAYLTGSHGRPPMGPHARRPGAPSWHRGPGCPPRSPDAKPSDARPRPRPEARPERTRRPKDEQPEARPERTRRPRDERPERTRRPKGEEPAEDAEAEA